MRGLLWNQRRVDFGFAFGGGLYMHMCVCVCVCVSHGRTRVRARDTHSDATFCSLQLIRGRTLAVKYNGLPQCSSN